MELPPRRQPGLTSLELNAASAWAAAEARAARRPEDPGRYGYEGCCVRTFWAVVETHGTFADRAFHLLVHTH